MLGIEAGLYISIHTHRTQTQKQQIQHIIVRPLLLGVGELALRRGTERERIEDRGQREQREREDGREEEGGREGEGDGKDRKERGERG